MERARCSALFAAAVGLDGFDPVSYFTPDGPAPGDRNIAESANEAEWWFATVDNREEFRANPEKYMPVFGGHCVFGASRGQAFAGNPAAWTIHDGHLYLSINRFVRAVMGPNPKRITKADRAWSDAA